MASPWLLIWIQAAILMCCQFYCTLSSKWLEPSKKRVIILRRICSKMDWTLKLQLVFKITVMGLSFSVKLALNFKYFERLWYYPLHYAYKTEIWKICCHFFCQKNMQATNSISLWYLNNILWISTVDFFINIRAKGGGAIAHFAPPLARAYPGFLPRGGELWQNIFQI